MRKRMYVLLLVTLILTLAACNRNESEPPALKEKYYLAVGEVLRLDNTAENIVWASSAPDIVRVNNDGVITGADVGTAVVSATINDRVYETTVCVEEAICYNLTPGKLDALERISYNGFRDAMSELWNFTQAGISEKVDFEATAQDTRWQIGASAENCYAEDVGDGLRLLSTGKENTSYMYAKLRVPYTVTALQIEAVGNADSRLSGSGAIRVNALYRNADGEYVVQMLQAKPKTLTQDATAEIRPDGTLRVYDAHDDLPGVLNGVIDYDISDLPTDRVVIILIESVGIGNTYGNADTQAAGGTPDGDLMTDAITIKRVLFVAETIPVDEGTPPAEPLNNTEQELMFKVSGTEALYLNFLPPTRQVYEKAPVLLVISGGGWKVQDRAAILGMMNTAVRELRAQGYAVVCADYRVITDDNGLTAREQVIDLRDACAYLAHYRDVLKIDTDHIVTLGHSAGGHLALMVTHASQESFPVEGFTDAFNVSACVGVGTVTFLYEQSYFRDLNDWTYTAYVDGVFDEELAISCSPYTYVTADCTPTLLIVGDKDNVVSPENTYQIMEKASAVGADFEMIVSHGGGHSLENMVTGSAASPNLDEALYLAVDWIRSKVAVSAGS